MQNNNETNKVEPVKYTKAQKVTSIIFWSLVAIGLGLAVYDRI